MRLVAALVAIPTLLGEDKVLFEEGFSGKLADGWSWVREESGAWKIEGGALKIKSLPGTIWFKTNNAKNLLLRKLPERGTEKEPVAVEVTVESAPAANAEQAGLYFYFDDNNYAKIVREYLKGKDGEGKINVVFAREQKNIPAVVGQKEEGAPAVRFRLLWSGAKIEGQYRALTAKDWTSLGPCEAPPGEGPSVGPAAHGAPADANRWAAFKEFRILKVVK